MLLLDDIEFTTTPQDAFTLGIEAGLLIRCHATASRDEIARSKFDILKELKRDMKAQIWRQVYSDLIPLAYDLCNEALRNADPSGAVQVKVERFLDLLTPKF